MVVEVGYNTWAHLPPRLPGKGQPAPRPAPPTAPLCIQALCGPLGSALLIPVRFRCCRDLQQPSPSPHLCKQAHVSQQCPFCLRNPNQPHKTQKKTPGKQKKYPKKPNPRNTFWTKYLEDTSGIDGMLRAATGTAGRAGREVWGRCVTFCCRVLSRDSTFICSLRSPACSAALSALALVRTWAISSLALGGMDRGGLGKVWVQAGAPGHGLRPCSNGTARLCLPGSNRGGVPVWKLDETGLIQLI